jgi:metallo-beta-lactamase family protein
MVPKARNRPGFPDFQFGETRGSALVSGAAAAVKIFGQHVAVKAQVGHLDGFSGHANAHDLMAWPGRFESALDRHSDVHGEAGAADALRARIQDEPGWTVAVPEHGSSADI